MPVNSKTCSTPPWFNMAFVATTVLSAGALAFIFSPPEATAVEPAARNGTGTLKAEYVTVEEVRKVCQQLRIRDWTQLKHPEVEPEEAKAILATLDTVGTTIQPDEFRRGLGVELEHGVRFKEANVTNNHPILTGKIVLAHLKEFPDYYKRLEILEIEGDLHKAILSGDSVGLPDLYRKLAKAKLALAQAEADQLAK
jgi:hypothetical protein